MITDEEGLETPRGGEAMMENDTSLNSTVNGTQDANETSNATSNMVSCNPRNETGIPAVEVMFGICLLLLYTIFGV